MKFWKIALLMLAPLMAAACMPKGVDGSASTTIPSKSEIDQKIAKASKQLAENCLILRTGIVIASQFNSKNTGLMKALDGATIAINAFCAKPPTDTDTAILQVADIAIQINQAIKAAKAAKG